MFMHESGGTFNGCVILLTSPAFTFTPMPSVTSPDFEHTLRKTR